MQNDKADKKVTPEVELLSEMETLNVRGGTTPTPKDIYGANCDPSYTNCAGANCVAGCGLTPTKSKDPCK